MSEYESHENRRHKRNKLSCPVTIFSETGEFPTTTASADVSDGGIYMSIPVSKAPGLASEVEITFSVPRDAFGIDCFSVAASVVRRESQANRAMSGVAMKFKSPLPLQLS